MSIEKRHNICWRKGLIVLFLFAGGISSLSAQPGIDTVSSAFFRTWYQTTDLGHYLDNSSPYVVYETETTGEWNLGDRRVFSVAGNSFRQTKYRLNGMRIDSRTQPGDAFLYLGMDRSSLALDYHSGELNFRDDTTQQQQVRLTGNAGGLGGISPGTRELINTFHKSATERTIDDRPTENRNRIIGAGTADVTLALPAHGRRYYQHFYAHYGQRQLSAFDQTGISGTYRSPYYAAQLDGEIPLNSQHSTLNYFLLAKGRNDYGSEFYYNKNEQARQQLYQAGLYATTTFANSGKMVYGLSYEMNYLRHDTLSFARNIIDQDGEAFEPWSADGRLHALNLSLRYDQQFLPWLRLTADGYNSVLHFHPTTAQWTNSVYRQEFNEPVPMELYTYHWHAQPFSSGILENEALLVAQKEVAQGLSLYGHLGVSLDGVVLENAKSVISPNWLAQFAMTYQPAWWFRFSVSVSHHRMSYTWNEAQYLSSQYLNGEARLADNSLLATTGGAYHTPDKSLWRQQPSYAVVDIPLYFTFGHSRRHEIAVLNTYRTYYNQWFTRFTDGVDANMIQAGDAWFYREGEKQYTLTTQPLDLLSSQPGTMTPYYISNMIRYTYSGRKWFVQLSWQSYLMSGLSTLGHGPLHNNLGALSESTADPNTLVVPPEGTKPYQANGRLNQDRAYIARLQVNYNACRYFSLGLNFKFKDGQPFTDYQTRQQTLNGHTQIVLLANDARGINPANSHFGKRKDAFFNLELRATGRWWVHEVPMSVEALCYNLYDFGTEIHEYTFTSNGAVPGRTALSLCIPRGLLFTLRVGLEKDKNL